MDLKQYKEGKKENLFVYLIIDQVHCKLVLESQDQEHYYWKINGVFLEVILDQLLPFFCFNVDSARERNSIEWTFQKLLFSLHFEKRYTFINKT